MKRTVNIIVLIVFGFLLTVVYSCDDASGVMDPVGEPAVHELACLLIDDVWKIVDARDTTETEVSVARGDTVVWYAPENRDMYFQFMDQELTGVYTKEVLQGESLTLVIGRDAEAGDNPYAVFVYEARVYAAGDSPPRMIVLD